VCADIVAWILDVNGAKPGRISLPAGGAALDRMTIR
jgi:hypothetical protein